MFSKIRKVNRTVRIMLVEVKQINTTSGYMPVCFRLKSHGMSGVSGILCINKR